MKFIVVFFSASIFCLLFIYGTADKYEVQDVQGGACECIDYNCGCCAQLHVESIIDGRLCSNFSYLPKDYGISATITYKDETIFNETVSATNPPPICAIHIEDLKMKICVRLHNLNYTGCFSGCADFEIEFFEVIPLKIIKLGCFGCRHSKYSNHPLLRTIYNNRDDEKQHENQPEVVLI